MASKRGKTAIAIAASLGATVAGLGLAGWAMVTLKPGLWQQIAATFNRSDSSEQAQSEAEEDERRQPLIAEDTLEEAADYLQRQAPLVENQTLEEAAAYLQRLQARQQDAAAVAVGESQQREIYRALEAAAKRARRQGWEQYPRRPNASNPRRYSLRRIDRIEQLKRRYQQQVRATYGITAQQADRILAAGRRGEWPRPEPIAMEGPPYVAPARSGHKGSLPRAFGS